MALIKCPECGKKISNKATMCIHCGCPLEYNTAGNEQIVEGIPVEDTVLCSVNPSTNSAYGQDNHGKAPKKKLKVYQNNWFIFPMLFFVFSCRCLLALEI